MEQKEPIFDDKGIETVRRDGCPAVGKVRRGGWERVGGRREEGGKKGRREGRNERGGREGEEGRKESNKSKPVPFRFLRSLCACSSSPGMSHWSRLTFSVSSGNSWMVKSTSRTSPLPRSTEVVSITGQEPVFLHWNSQSECRGPCECDMQYSGYCLQL